MRELFAVVLVLVLGLASASSAAPPDPVRYSGEKLSLDFRDVEVRALIKVLSDLSGQPIRIDDAVGGRTAVSLKDIPWDQALDIIAQSRGLVVRRESGALVVEPAGAARQP